MVPACMHISRETITNVWQTAFATIDARAHREVFALSP